MFFPLFQILPSTFQWVEVEYSGGGFRNLDNSAINILNIDLHPLLGADEGSGDAMVVGHCHTCFCQGSFKFC